MPPLIGWSSSAETNPISSGPYLTQTVWEAHRNGYPFRLLRILLKDFLHPEALRLSTMRPTIV
jgi:hypothetical protein